METSIFKLTFFLYNPLWRLKNVLYSVCKIPLNNRNHPHGHCTVYIVCHCFVVVFFFLTGSTSQRCRSWSEPLTRSSLPLKYEEIPTQRHPKFCFVFCGNLCISYKFLEQTLLGRPLFKSLDLIFYFPHALIWNI